MFTKILNLLGVIVVAVIVFEVIKLVLVALGIIVPAIIITLVGLLILIAVVVWALKLFGLDI